MSDKPERREALGGGMEKTKLEKYASTYEKLKAEMDEVRGDLGAEVKQFEEDGGHKGAFKLALKLKSMETHKAQEFIRSLNAYLDLLGIADQHDLFDDLPGQVAMPSAPEAPDAPEASAVH